MTGKSNVSAKAVFVAFAAFLTAASVAAEDVADQRPTNWHQWRGPEATGVAPLGDPPTRWDEQTNIKWKVSIPGLGTSTPIVWGDRIFLLTAIKTDRLAEVEPAAAAHRPAPAVREVAFAQRDDDDDREDRGDDDRVNRGERRRPERKFYHQFVVLCLERGTGETVWQRVACEVVPHQGHHPSSSFVSSSPVTDGRHLYASFGSRGVYCYDFDGNQKWRAELGQFTIKFGFGEGSSPALFGDTLVVNCDHEGESFITALDTASGERKWTMPRDENSTWNTPLVAEHGGRSEVIVNGAQRARSYDLATGKLLWEYGERRGVDAIPSPLRCGDLAIFISGLRGDPAYAISLGASGDLTGTEQLAWRHAEGTPQVSSAVLVGERLYFTKDRVGILTCLNARTGEVIIDQKRLPSLEDIYASPVAAAGRIYFTARNGVTVVIDANPNEVEVLAENQLEETIVGSPAIVGREMFIRGDKSLYCIAH